MTDEHENDSQQPADASSEESEGRPKIVITSDEGVAMADPSEDPTQGVPEPAKVMRIGTMIKQLLEEVKAAPLDEAARDKLAELHERSVNELKGALSDELAEEIDRIVLPSRRLLRGGDPGRACATRRLAGGSVPRYPDRAGGPADARAEPAQIDAPATSARDDPAAAGRAGGAAGQRRAGPISLSYSATLTP